MGLKKAAEIAETSGYAWVRPILETRVTYNATEDLHQIHLEPPPLTEEEQVEADKLLETISVLEAESETLDEDDEAAAADFQARWDAASSAYDALHDKPPVIPEESPERRKAAVLPTSSVVTPRRSGAFFST